MKRLPSASAAVVIRAMENAALGPPSCPDHVRLRDGDRPFWDGIIASRARDEWTQADMVVAAQLARCQADIEREQATMDGETSVITNARGTEVMNPRLSVLEQLARREMALMRTLRMGGKIAGDPRDEAGRRAAEKRAGMLREELADDELLAT